MERAKDFVPAGIPLQDMGMEMFIPPAPCLTYLMGILSPSLNAGLEISKAEAPKDKKARKRVKKKTPFDIISSPTFIISKMWRK
jgi:hypothetical protein